MDKQELKAKNILINILLFICAGFLLVSILLSAKINHNLINFIVIIFAIYFPKKIKFL